MNVTTTKTEFAPVSITLTFQTQEELDAFGSLMNCASVGDTMVEIHGFDVEPIYKAIEHAGGNIGLTRPIFDAIRKAK